MKNFFKYLALLCLALGVAGCAAEKVNVSHTQGEPLRLFVSSATSEPLDPTKWPRQVPIRQPDPILGNAPVLEIWSYDKQFAERFEGFPVEQAEPKMPQGTHAVVLKVYRERLTTYNEYQYQCVSEYFVSDKIPVSREKPLAVDIEIYKKLIQPTIYKLKARSDKDRALIARAQNADFIYPVRAGVTFTDGAVLKGIAARRIVDSRPLLVEGIQWLSTSNFGSGAYSSCDDYYYPRHAGSTIVLHFGDQKPFESYPWQLGKDRPTNAYGGGKKPIEPPWYWSPLELVKGTFALPAAWTTEAMRMRMWADRDNRCVVRLKLIKDNKSKASPETIKNVLEGCQDYTKTGKLFFDPMDFENFWKRFEIN